MCSCTLIYLIMHAAYAIINLLNGMITFARLKNIWMTCSF